MVILAAGRSTRLGRPKQLLPYLGHTLIEHSVEVAIASEAQEVVVVLGSHPEAIREKLEGLPIQVVVNDEWLEGMGSSIRAGVKALPPNIGCVVIALCDQPTVTPDLIRELAERHFEAGSPIVASSYDGVVGAPCAFGRELFLKLLELSGDSGARDLIRNSPNPVDLVSFQGGNLDVDTPEDFQRLVAMDQNGEPDALKYEIKNRQTP